MFRFLHTSDWQIGMKAVNAGRQGDRVRAERLRAAERVVEIAHREGVGVILITGDIFEDNAVDRVLVRQVGDILKAFRGEVFLLPGNHDPYVPGSVWGHPVWEESPSLRVLVDREPVSVDGATLYPCPLLEKYSLRSPLTGVLAQEAAGICVGLVHGNVSGLEAGDVDFPIPRDAAARHGLDYVALGHWHSYARFEVEGACRMAYCGTHETTKFGERDSGNVVLVEIAERGSVPELKPIRSGGLRWLDWEVSVGSKEDLKALRQRLDGEAEPQDCLLRLRVSGCLPSDGFEALQEIEEVLAAQYLVGALDRSQLRASPEESAWVDALPEGPFQAVGRHLLEAMASAQDHRETQVTKEALLTLFELQEKARS